jgi:hypothetical protein
VSKIDSLISDVESAIETLAGVNARLREMKEDTEAVEKARDRLRGRKRSKKADDTQ